MKTIRYKLFFTDEQILMTGINEYFDKLRAKYELIETDDSPDIVIYCEDKFEYLKYKNAIRIFWCVENIQPNFSVCDYAIGNCRIEYCDRYFRYPYYMLPQNRHMYLDASSRPKMSIEELQNKTEFCNFIYSNAYCDPHRKDIFEGVSKYKFVHSAGSFLNNTDKPPLGKTWNETFSNKIEYQKKFKFTLAIENSSAYGYLSEKIINAYQARTIPVYWGDPCISETINAKSFINCHDYDSIDDIVARIAEIDQDDEKYLDMFNQGIDAGDWRNDANQLDERIIKFFDNIFEKGRVQRNYAYYLHDYKEESRYTEGLYRFEKKGKMRQTLVVATKKILRR